MKNVLFIASEAVPFIKTGGLADVVGSLPKYFDKEKFDVRVMIPKYTCIPWEYRKDIRCLKETWRSRCLFCSGKLSGNQSGTGKTDGRRRPYRWQSYLPSPGYVKDL